MFSTVDRAVFLPLPYLTFSGYLLLSWLDLQHHVVHRLWEQADLLCPYHWGKVLKSYLVVAKSTIHSICYPKGLLCAFSSFISDAMTKYPDSGNFNGRKGLSGMQFQVTVYHWGKVKAGT